ncbi:hypothetical protein [Neokomagataea anthophila]|uniref:Uncharacterized protein n=1 Tax=Neokomagataea anthophila TaxID=2826925 RepID=A0ABS5E467_9PROT|nr:hypothetical protein [Neokomagataea anthophila]MBR0558692.1 hypothetical protein [Neokomagataea anthophila]
MKRVGAVLLGMWALYGSCAEAQDALSVKHRHHHHRKVKGMPVVAAPVAPPVPAMSEQAAAVPPSVGGLPALPTGWAVVGKGRSMAATTKGDGLTPISADVAVSGLWLPLGERTPIAMFREGTQGVIVAGGEHGLDTLGSLEAGGFAPVRSHVLPGVTIITFTLPQGMLVGVRPQGAGWVVAATADVQAEMSLGRWGSGLSFVPPEQDAALESVQIDDPLSGRRLLVGMVRAGHVSSERIVRGDGYLVRPSLIGLVVAADEDALELRNLAGRFVLDRIGPAEDPLFAMRDLPDSGAALNGVSLGQGTPEALRGAVRDAWFAVSASSPGERLNTRIHLAQSTARLGQAAQTDQVLQTIIRDEPEASGRSDVRRLQQVSSVLLGRVRDDALMDDGGTAPEDQFWRGMMRTLPEDPRLGQRPVPERLKDPKEQAQTAYMIAAGLPSLMSYAQPLQAALLGPAALWVARYGDVTAQKALDSVPKTPDTALAYAVRDMRAHAPQAKHELDILAHSASPHIWPVARFLQLQQGVESKQLSQEEAVHQLDRLMPGFRMAGIGSEAQHMLLEAQLQAGQMRDALMGLLRGQHTPVSGEDGEALQRIAYGMRAQLPENVEQRAEEAGLLRQILTQRDRMPVETQRTFRQALAERYKSLGLPFDEREVLQSITEDENPRAHQKRLMRLVELDLAIGDLDMAARDLAHFPEIDVPPVGALPGGEGSSDLACLKARLLMAQKRPVEAIAVLQPYTDHQASALLAEVAEAVKDWRTAEAARLKQLGAENPSPAGFDEVQAGVVLHAAGDASRAQDVTTQEALWSRYRDVMMRTSSAGLFRIVTGHAVE